jgi:hypothetical protein
MNEAQLVKPSVQAGVTGSSSSSSSSSSSQFNRTGNSSINSVFMDDSSNNNGDNTIVVNNGGQKLVLKPMIQANDVDDMIIEEREKEIKKLHQDLLLVNSMYK